MAQLHKKITYRIFDKQFLGSTHIYDRDFHNNNEYLPGAEQNRLAIINALGANQLLVLNEVHGNTVIDADNNHDFTQQYAADAAVTQTPGLALSVQSADCVPILLASHSGTVIGVAHCGWRSAHANILQNVVELMRMKGASNLHAVIGPAIHQINYEVDNVFFETIMASENAEHLFVPSQNPQHHLFDLPGFVTLKLNQLGITEIINRCENTYAHPLKYFSYRRDVHLGTVGVRTNILSGIVIDAAE